MNSKNVFSHRNLQSIPSNNFNKNYPKISPFIVEGEFSEQKPKIKEKYSLQNFKYLTDMNDEPIIIGKGGYGKLYLSKNIIDNKEYAIKNISKKKMKEVKVDTSIIKREIDVHIRITHPHIIKLYSYMEDRYNFYLAMEYAQKGTLYKLIQQKNGMDENEAFHYFIQVVSAIHFLHMNGYAHRDIKPENILLDKNSQVKLCDFGWCVNVSKGERITFCGTYEYMAPEMINDEFYDMGIDIWSLGVLLYEMIHGYSPFRAHYFLRDAKNAMKEIFMNIKNNNYVIERNISEECIDLIDKLLTIDPKKRIKINEIFLHPWVINKEKKYFPSFTRIIKIRDEYKDNNNNFDEDINEGIYHKNNDNNIYNNYIKNNNLYFKEKNKEKIIEKEGNFENFKNKNDILIDRINNDKYKMKNECDLIKQILEKKQHNSLNNFVYTIDNSKEKKNENFITNNSNESQIKSNLTELKQNKNKNYFLNISKIHQKNKNEFNIKNIYIEKRRIIEKNVDLIKQKEKPNVQLNINIIKGRKEELNNSRKINKNDQISFVYNKPKKNIGTYVIKNLSKERTINKITSQNKNRDKRAKSVDKSLTENNMNFFSKINILKNISKEKAEIEINNSGDNQDKKSNNSNQIQNLRLNDLRDNIKGDFHRFRKKVVHIKKRSFLKENNFKFINKKEKPEDKFYHQLSNKTEKSVQNIFYNTFYNCNFNNIPNNPMNLNINNNETYTNNFYVKLNNNIRNRNQIKKSNTFFNKNLKSFSLQKNYYKCNSDEIQDKNNVDDLINYCTEKKIGKVYTSKINIIRSENFEDKNNRRYIITKSERKKLINTRKVSPYKMKEIFISSYS